MDEDDRGFVAIPEKFPELTEADIKKIQAHVHELLRGFVGPRPLARPGGGHILRYPTHSQYGVAVRYVTWKTPGRLTVEGPYRDCVLAVTGSLLSDPDAVKSLLYCPEPECGRVFYRRSRQKYCSTRCTNRAQARTYRENHPGTFNTPRLESKSPKVNRGKNPKPKRPTKGRARA